MKASVLASLVLVPAAAYAQAASSASSAVASASEAVGSAVSSASASASGSESMSMSSMSGSASASAPSASSSGAAAGDQGAYLQAVLGALTGAGLTSLVGVAQSIASTDEGSALLSALAVGNKTVFAPSNAAFESVPEEVSSNTTLLTQILAYHVLNSSYLPANVSTFPNHTIARSVLANGTYAMLPGGRAQPLVLSKNSSDAQSFQINQATSNISATGPVAAANLQVYVIDQVISLPMTLGEVATAAVPQAAGLISNAGLLEPLQQATGITVFAPNDAAIGAISQALGSLNETQVQAVLSNHVINGTVAYSSLLGAGNYTSAGGEPFMFTSNSSGTYVMSGTASARVVQSDIIIANGVVHVIDAVLVNAESNPGAAQSAFESASAAATQTEAPGGVAPQSSSPGGSASATPSGAAGALVAGNKGLVGMAVAFFGVLAGGGFLLL